MPSLTFIFTQLDELTFEITVYLSVTTRQYRTPSHHRLLLRLLQNHPDGWKRCRGGDALKRQWALSMISIYICANGEIYIHD
jgi:hypothetical protein